MTDVLIFEGRTLLDRYREQEHRLARHSPGELMTARLRYFSPALLDNQVTFVLERDNKAVALAGCEAAPTGEVLWLCYVSVDPFYRDQGLSSRLLEHIADYVRSKQFRMLDCSGYSPVGLERLRPVLLRNAVGFSLRDRPVAEYHA